jgi:hypothetical protein
MNTGDLHSELLKLGIRSDSYSLSGGHPSEAYVLSHEGQRWAVYYGERGQETSRVDFDNEADACSHVLKLIVEDSTTRHGSGLR